jgi:hypothetical protein
VVGSGPGRVGEVRIFDPDGRKLATLRPFGDDYTGGISVAAGDLNGDGRDEIVAGTLAPPMRVQAFDGGDPLGPLHTLSFAPDAGAQVAVADLDGTGEGSIVVGASRGTDPLVAVLSPLTGTVVAKLRPYASVPDGIRVAAGDVNGDGRDEIVVAPSFGGDGTVRIYSHDLRPVRAFTPYQWAGAGMYVGVVARVGLPIVAEPRRVRLVARKRMRVVVARFRDAAGAGFSGMLSAKIDWGDGTSWNGAVLGRGDGVYDVRSRKRFLAAGRYGVTVTLRDDRGRSSIARGTAVVVAAKR